jgi:hypothetical protein
VRSFPRETSIAMIGKLLGEPTRNEGLDSMAFRAFDVSPSDTSVVRRFLRFYRDAGSRIQARAFAARMLRLTPNDAEAQALIEEEARREAALKASGPNGVRSR